jgi:hypothetical protein
MTTTARRALWIVPSLVLAACAAVADPDATPVPPSPCEQFIAAAEALELISSGEVKHFSLRDAIVATIGEERAFGGLRCGPWPAPG